MRSLSGQGPWRQVSWAGVDRTLGWSSQPSRPVLLLTGCENPKPSVTELVVLEHGLYAGDPVSKVLLQPLTGTSGGGDQEAVQAPLLSVNDVPRAPGAVDVWHPRLFTRGAAVSLLLRVR